MNTQQYLDNKPPDWVRVEMQSFRFKKLVSAYNRMRLKNDSMRITGQQWLELALIYRPKLTKDSPVIATKKTISLMKNEQVRIYADSLLGAALEESNIDVKYVVSKRKDILDKAIENKQLNVANQTLDVIEDYMGMKRIMSQSGNTETESREIDYIKIDENADEPKELTAEQKKLTPTSITNSLPS